MRPELFKHNFAMRMLRWLMLEGEATQAELMREYRRIGAAGSSYKDDFGRYTRSAETPDERRVILRVQLPASTRYLVRWAGPTVEAWLATTPDDELQRGLEAMERALVETDDAHFADWLARIRDEVARRVGT